MNQLLVSNMRETGMQPQGAHLRELLSKKQMGRKLLLQERHRILCIHVVMCGGVMPPLHVLLHVWSDDPLDIAGFCICICICRLGFGLAWLGIVYSNIQSSPYFDPTHTRTGWIGQPPILNRHEVVTIDGDVDILGQATP